MMKWEKKLSVWAIVAAALLALYTCFDKAPTAPSKPAKFYLVDPLCPTGIFVAQRYDKRDKWGLIVERKWKRVCIA